jgi:hypothetical protein
LPLRFFVGARALLVLGFGVHHFDDIEQVRERVSTVKEFTLPPQAGRDRPESVSV